MDGSCFEIVLDVMAQEVDMLRYREKTANDENIKLRNRVKALEEENAKLRVMIDEERENHE